MGDGLVLGCIGFTMVYPIKDDDVAIIRNNGWIRLAMMKAASDETGDTFKARGDVPTDQLARVSISCSNQ